MWSGFPATRKRAKVCRAASRALRVVMLFRRAVSRKARKRPTRSAVMSATSRDFDRPSAVSGSELQEQDQAVAIALDRMAAHTAERRKVLLEEADDRSAKAGRLIRLHADTSSTTSPKATSKRSLASWRIAGMKCR